MRDDFDFHDCTLGQRGDLDRGARGKIAGEILCVDFIHAGEVREVRDENGALHHVGKSELLIIENCFYIFQNTFGLRFDVARDEISSGGIEWNLSRAEKQITGANGVIVRPDGGSGFCRFDDLFVHSLNLKS